MIRSCWIGALVVGWSTVGLALGFPPGTTSPPRPSVWAKGKVLLIREQGKPAQRCQVLAVHRQDDGSVAYQVRDLNTGQTMTLLDNGTVYTLTVKKPSPARGKQASPPVLARHQHPTTEPEPAGKARPTLLGRLQQRLNNSPTLLSRHKAQGTEPAGGAVVKKQVPLIRKDEPRSAPVRTTKALPVSRPRMKVPPLPARPTRQTGGPSPEKPSSRPTLPVARAREVDPLEHPIIPSGQGASGTRTGIEKRGNLLLRVSAGNQPTSQEEGPEKVEASPQETPDAALPPGLGSVIAAESPELTVEDQQTPSVAMQEENAFSRGQPAGPTALPPGLPSPLAARRMLPQPPSPPLRTVGVSSGMGNAFTQAGTRRPIPADFEQPDQFANAFQSQGVPTPGGMMASPRPARPGQQMTGYGQAPNYRMPPGMVPGGMVVVNPALQVPSRPAAGGIWPTQAAQSPEYLLAVLERELSPALREWAVDQLSQVDWHAAPQVAEGLRQAAARDLAPAVRVACVRALGEMKVNTVPVVETVKALQTDKDPQVRQAAQTALSSLVPESAENPPVLPDRGP
jgi:hypothetical protein